MSLNENYDLVEFPPTHYVYLEVFGPFQETAPAAWQEVVRHAPALAAKGTLVKGMSLFKVDKSIYRAGFTFSAKPEQVPAGLGYTLFEGGKYLRFVLTGSFKQLPEACGRVFNVVAAKNIQTEDRFCVENYVTDPATTPEDKLVTEILIPTK